MVETMDETTILLRANIHKGMSIILAVARFCRKTPKRDFESAGRPFESGRGRHYELGNRSIHRQAESRTASLALL